MGCMRRGSRRVGPGSIVLGCAALVAATSFAVLPGSAGSASTRSATTTAGGGGHDLNIGFSPPPKGPGTSVSLNWAGYAVTGTPVTSVAGSWIQPGASCPANKVQQSAFWVGIDGFAATDPTVQQIGTDADCLKGSKKVPGGPVYYAWYEMYPSSALFVLNPSIYPVSPGNSISASVVLLGTSYVLTITDAGHWLFQTTQPSGSPLPLNLSAEWIAEAPLICSGKCKAIALADFSSVTFSGATVNGQAVDAPGLTDIQINMSKSKKGTPLKASTSALDATGHVFTVTWLSN